MPIYEYFCPENNTIYSFLARRPGMAGAVPRCPADPQFTMQKRVSSFAVIGAERKSGGETDEDALEEAMMSMEKEFSGLDEKNPDPRQLGRLMRRMGELTGQEFGGAMEEMIGRLERGEDPDALEEEYGDVLDDEFPEDPGDLDPDAPEFGEKASVWQRIRQLRRSRAPRRDPRIYELSEYV